MYLETEGNSPAIKKHGVKPPNTRKNPDRPKKKKRRTLGGKAFDWGGGKRKPGG